MRPELIVVDVDGTLLGRDHRVAPRVRTAVAAAMTAGIQVALSTGRPMTSLLKVAMPLGLNGPHVAFDGALVATAGEWPIFRQPISKLAARGLVDAARARGLLVELYTAAAHYVDRLTPEAQAHGELIGVQPTPRHLDEVIAQSAEGDLLKGQIIGCGEAERAKIRAIEELGLPFRLGWARPPPGMGDLDYVNVTHPDVSKGPALVALARALGVSIERTMAVGDGPNDAPLLEAAGLAVAMGNAATSLKALADFVVPSVDDDGLAVAIERHALA